MKNIRNTVFRAFFVAQGAFFVVGPAKANEVAPRGIYALVAMIPVAEVQAAVSAEARISHRGALKGSAQITGAYFFEKEEVLGAPGLELEIRSYFCKDRFAGWNVNFTLQGAYIVNLEWWTLIAGLKFVYTFAAARFASIEPFFALQAPFYKDLSSNSTNGFYYGIYPLFAIGIRLVFETLTPPRKIYIRKDAADAAVGAFRRKDSTEGSVAYR